MVNSVAKIKTEVSKIHQPISEANVGCSSSGIIIDMRTLSKHWTFKLWRDTIFVHIRSSLRSEGLTFGSAQGTSTVSKKTETLANIMGTHTTIFSYCAREKRRILI